MTCPFQPSKLRETFTNQDATSKMLSAMATKMVATWSVAFSKQLVPLHCILVTVTVTVSQSQCMVSPGIQLVKNHESQSRTIESQFKKQVPGSFFM